MEQRQILDQYLTSRIVSTRSIQTFKRHPILKTLTKNFSVNFKVLDLEFKISEGVGKVQHSVLDLFLISGKVLTRSS